MREIFFRGKRLGDGKWVYWDQFGRFTETQSRKLITGKEGLTDWAFEILTHPATVGQYTGLKDKNGVKIFEGDIVNHHVQGNILVSRGVVAWDGKNGRWAYQLKTMMPDFTFFNPNAWEVIGNIHDNPELLRTEE